MTICVAALCHYSHGKKEDGAPDLGFAIVTAADRMFTDSGLEIEYETGQGKWAALGRRVLLLVADSMPIQSEIIGQLRASIVDHENISAREAADLYSQMVIKYKREEAEKLFLSPYGMTMEFFVKAIQTSTSQLMNELAQNILDHSIDVEAIVAGVSEQGEAALYHVDNRGKITSHSDIAFVSIGSGHYHSNAYLTSHGYWNRWLYYSAICAVYAAKRQAENAPGVGKGTDLHLITKDGWQDVDPHMRAALDVEYPTYTGQLGKMEGRMVEKVWKRARKALEKAQAAAAKG